MKVLVTIPAYNEGGSIEKTIADIEGFGFDICVIDDGSRDETVKLVKGKDSIILLQNEGNYGQGYSIRRGMEYAIQHRYNIVAHYDADGQHSPEDLLKMISLIKDNPKLDIILGSRFLKRESRLIIPRSKRYFLLLARVFENYYTGINLTDAHCGIRVLNMINCKNMVIKSNGMAHASDIIKEIKRLNLNYIEVPVRVSYVKDSFIANVKRSFEVILELLRSR